MKRWQRRIPRPSLLWMSVDDVMRVRNAIITLYLGPGESIDLAPPRGCFDVRGLCVGLSASKPVFHWRVGEGPQFSAWLQVRHFWPCWDYAEAVAPASAFPGPVEPLDFNDPKCRIPATIIKAWSDYFPYVSTDNYLVNNGEVIA